MLLRSLLVLLACLSLAFITTPAQAQQVQLTWDAPVQANGSPVSNLAGYKLYYGSQSGQYPTMIQVGLKTTYTVTNLSAGQTYYFAAKAYDTKGLESAFSNEVSVTLPKTPPSVTLSAAPPSIAAGQATTLAWTTSHATSCSAPWTTSKATSGSQSVTPTATTTYTMSCTGAGGTATASAVVTVTVPPKPSVTLSAAPASVLAGQATTLAWTATNATSCSAAWTTSKATAGSHSITPSATTTYTMSCTGAGGTATASAVVTVTVPPKPSVTLSAAPASVLAGQATTLAWTATNATSCSAAWTTSKATAGSHSITPSATTTYTMSCTGAGGTTAASTVVTVTTPPKPSMTLSAVPASLTAGQAATLTWAASNATSCNASWTTSKATSGSQSVKPTATTTYTMSCTGAGGTTAASTVVTVTVPPKPSMTLSAAPPSIAAGQATTLTWTASHATSCSAPWTGSTATSGSQSVTPTATTTYTMNCTGAGGTTAASTVVTVTINTPPGSLIPQQQIRVESVDSQDTVGGNYAATNALDGKPATMWHTEWAQRAPAPPHTLVLDLGARYQVDGFRYLPRQDGNSNGTIANYQFYVSDDGTTWGSAVAAGTLAANTSEKTVRFTAKTGRFVRLVALSEINGKPYTSAAELNFFGAAVVSTPTSSIIPQQQLRVVSVDSQDTVGGNYAATNALDGKPATMWHTEWAQRAPAPPHTLVLDLGARYQVDGFRYLPRQDGNSNGTIANYQFYVSDDGTTWGSAVAAGTLAANTSEKTVRFTAKTGRFVRLVALSEINGKPYTSAAELNFFGAAVSSSTTTTSNLLSQSVTTSPVTSAASTSTMTVSKSTKTTSHTSASQPTTQTASATVSSATSSSSTPTMTANQNTPWETALTSTKMYANPFTDVTVTVEYTKAGSPPLRSYGFWDGDTTFKLRQAFPESGTWHYKTTATDTSNSGLHNREGDVYVQPYTGTNPLYRHGFLQVSADRRFLAHADGIPFLWVGDTLWGAPVWLTEAGFHEAIADRRAKHFTVLQTNFAHKDEVDTAGDTPWEGDRWNVRFMQKLDRMFTDANDQGMYLFVNGLVDLFWDRNIANYDRLVEMIGARYAAHHVSFASSMDDSYNSLLSGNFGYMYGISLWDAEDADLPTWKALSDATYMPYPYDFFVALDGGRPLQPRHTLIKNQATRYQDRMVLGVSTDGMTYAAFLPNGGTIDIDLEALAGTTVGVTWYNPLTGQYHDQGTIPGGAAVHSFTSPFGASQSALVLMAH